MSLLDKTTNAIKKLGNALKETTQKVENTNQTTTSGNGDWIGSGGKSSPGGTSKKSELDYGTYKDDLDRLTEAQKKYQVAQLKSARDKALANLDVQEQSIKPTYQNARNITSAASQANARSFAEYMANRGLTNSGAAAQAEINRGSALQNNLGNINTAEANAFRDIANQRTQVQNDYANGVATANAAIQQQYLNNLLNYNEQQRQYINGLKERALGQYANDYQAHMNTLDPNSLEYLQTGARKGDKVLGYVANAYTYPNSMNNILNGTWSANDLIATGRTQEQAQRLFEDNQAQLQAQAQLEAEQRAWDRYAAQTKLDNDTAYNNARIANTNASTSNYYDQINKRGNTNYTNEFNSVMKAIEGMSTQEAENYIDALVNLNEQTGEQVISEPVAKSIYQILYGGNG